MQLFGSDGFPMPGTHHSYISELQAEVPLQYRVSANRISEMEQKNSVSEMEQDNAVAEMGHEVPTAEMEHSSMLPEVDIVTSSIENAIDEVGRAI